MLVESMGLYSRLPNTELKSKMPLITVTAMTVAMTQSNAWMNWIESYIFIVSIFLIVSYRIDNKFK